MVEKVGWPAGQNIDAEVLGLGMAMQPLLRMLTDTSSVAHLRVSPAQLQAVWILNDQGPLNLTRLASALDAIPSSASRLCDRLIAAGLVARTGASEDRREVILSLTREGRHVVETISDHRLRQLHDALASLSPGQRRTMVRSISLLSDQLTALDGASVETQLQAGKSLP